MILLIISPTGATRFFTGYPDQSTVYRAETHIQVMIDLIIVQAGREMQVDCKKPFETSDRLERLISELRNRIQVCVIEDVDTPPERIFPHEPVEKPLRSIAGTQLGRENDYAAKLYCPYCTTEIKGDNLVRCPHWTGTRWIKDGGGRADSTTDPGAKWEENKVYSNSGMRMNLDELDENLDALSKTNG